MSELLPCPFCGLHGDELEVPNNGIWLRVFCDGCGAEGGKKLSEDAAIAAWNRRAPPPSPAPGVVENERKNLGTLYETRRRLIEWGKSHREIDLAIEQTETALSALSQPHPADERVDTTGGVSNKAEEGRQAYKNGQSKDSNPYPQGSARYWQWSSGWLDERAFRPHPADEPRKLVKDIPETEKPYHGPFPPSAPADERVVEALREAANIAFDEMFAVTGAPVARAVQQKILALAQEGR